jgi:hypothetical protein
MDRDKYRIAADADGWALILNEQVLGSGMERERAERAATAAARMSASRGRDASITLEEGEDGSSEIYNQFPSECSPTS